MWYLTPINTPFCPVSVDPGAGCYCSKFNQLNNIVMTYKVIIKLSYMAQPIINVCNLPTYEDVMRFYSLSSDKLDDTVEWYKIIRF